MLIKIEERRRIALMNSALPTLTILKAIVESAYLTQQRSFWTYMNTDTDHVETPASAHEWSLEQLTTLHPLFALLLMRRNAYYRDFAIYEAAKTRLAAAEQPLVLPGLDLIA